MIDIKICRKCRWWRIAGGWKFSEFGWCGYMDVDHGRPSRVKTGNTKNCTAFEPRGREQKKNQNRCIKANNARRDAVRKLASEGKTDVEISRQTDYPVRTVVEMRKELLL
jgi:hypothetical protein